MSTALMTQSSAQLRFFDVPTLFSRAVGLISRLFGAYHDRCAFAALGEVSDYVLADIGLTRSDVRDAFAEPVWRDPTSLMRRRALERRGARRGM